MRYNFVICCICLVAIFYLTAAIEPPPLVFQDANDMKTEPGQQFEIKFVKPSEKKIFTKKSLPKGLHFLDDDHKGDALKHSVKKVLFSPVPIRRKRSPDAEIAVPQGGVVDTPVIDETSKADVKQDGRRSNSKIKNSKKSGGRQRRARPAKSGGKKNNHPKPKKTVKPKKSKRHTPRPGRRNEANQGNKRGSPGPGNLGPKSGRRLIAALQTRIENYPYVVSIQKDGEHWCSGALLNPRLVITTANCFWRSSRRTTMRIRACSHLTDSLGQKAKIMEIAKHPKFSIRAAPDYDIALALLDRNIRFSHSCHAVDLPNRMMPAEFEDAWVTSWGTERREGTYSIMDNRLQAYHARMMNWGTCNNITLRYGVKVTHNFICLEQAGKRAPCTRDTGAPAVSDGVLWGLASWGIRKLCGTERVPAMFTNVASPNNMDFLIKATTYLMSEERISPFLDRMRGPSYSAFNNTHAQLHQVISNLLAIIFTRD